MNSKELKQELYRIIDTWKSESEKKLEVGDRTGLQNYEKDLKEEIDSLCEASIEYYQKRINNIRTAGREAKKNISAEQVIKDGCVLDHLAKTDINFHI